MNILILSWRDPKHPLSGGAEQVTHEHAKGWIQKGFGVYLFSSRFKGSKSYEVIDGVNVIRRGSQYLGVHIAAFFYYLRNREKFSVVVDQFHGIPFFTPLYVFGKPVIANIHETAKKVWFLNHFPFPVNSIIGTIGYFLEPLIFLLYRSVPFIVVSKSTKRDLTKIGITKNNIYILPAGSLVPKHKLTIKKEPAIIYLGPLSKDKGIEDALKCFSFLLNHKELRFWVVGKSVTEKYGQSLRRLAIQMGFGRRIKFFGFVNDEKKFELLSKAYLLINPSVREGWGLVNIEANSQGTPVVAYSSAGLVDSVKNGVSGVLCQKNTPEELAYKVVDLIRQKNLYRRLQRGAYVWSRKFSWERSRKISLRILLLLKQKYHSAA